MQQNITIKTTRKTPRRRTISRRVSREYGPAKIEDTDYNPKEELREYLRRYIETNLDFTTTTIANYILNEATEASQSAEATINQIHVRNGYKKFQQQLETVLGMATAQMNLWPSLQQSATSSPSDSPEIKRHKSSIKQNILEVKAEIKKLVPEVSERIYNEIAEELKPTIRATQTIITTN